MAFFEACRYVSAMAEKAMAEVSSAVREQFRKGNAALAKPNWDYAIEILKELLRQEPGFFEARMALHAAQIKKGQSAGLFSKVVGVAGNAQLIARGQLALRNNPVEALNLAEEILGHDPSSHLGHRLLADAAALLEMPRTAIASLEAMRKARPDDKKICLQLSGMLEKVNQAQQAEGLLKQLCRIYPDDQSLFQELKNVSARITMKDGGYNEMVQEEGGYRSVLRNEAETVALEQEHLHQKPIDTLDMLIDKAEAQLAEEPDNLRHAIEVARLNVQKKEFDRALEYYHYALEKGIADAHIERAIYDTQIAKLNHTLSLLDSAEPSHAAEIERIRAERATFIIEDCKRRAEKYPTDMSIRFELGQLHFKAGQLSEAIHELQRAQTNPGVRLTAMNFLGQCFAQRGMHDIAIRTFRNALREKLVFDEERKELHYFLGCELQKVNKDEEAIEQFKHIYELDIGYRDVAAKVDAYYAKIDAQGTAPQ